MPQILHDLLHGRPHPDAPPAVARIVTGVVHFLRWCLHHPPRPEPPDGHNRAPDAGQPAPLSPSPAHHLVAAKSLPPRDETRITAAD